MSATMPGAPAARGPRSAISGPLASCRTFGAARVGEPCGQRGEGRRRRASTRSSVARGTVRGRHAPARGRRRGPGPSARPRATPTARRACAAARPPPPVRTAAPSSTVEPALGLRLAASAACANSRSRSTRNSRPSKTWCTSSRSHGRTVRSASAERQLEVVDQPVEPPVAQHLVEVGAQALARLAPDLRARARRCRRDRRRRSSHLAAVFGPTPGTPGRLSLVSPTRAARSLYALGGTPYRAWTACRGHPGQLGDPAHRVEHGDVVVDQLEGVPVAGADQHLEAGPAAPAGSAWR